MVKLVLLVFFVTTCHLCKCQLNEGEKDVRFDIVLNTDTAQFNDTVVVNLILTNNSKKNIEINSKCKIGLCHYHPEAFISYDSPKRIMYDLNNSFNNNSIITLKTGTCYKIQYSVFVDSSFFYSKQNKLIAFYNIYTTNNKKREKAIFSFWSNVVTIWVKKNNATPNPASL